MDTLDLLVNKFDNTTSDDATISNTFPSWPADEYIRVWTDGLATISGRTFRTNRSVDGEKSAEPVRLAERFGRSMRRLGSQHTGESINLLSLLNLMLTITWLPRASRCCSQTFGYCQCCPHRCMRIRACIPWKSKCIPFQGYLSR